MKKYRHFDEEFKREVVARIDSGEVTKSQVSREHNLSPSLVDRWQKQIHDGSMRSRPSAREKQLERELERYKKKVGEQSMQIDLLKKLKDFSVSMKRSNGYVVTGKLSGQSGKGAK